ncbi:hypothetical protein Tco_0413073 [Tanacetum coccineum]
MKSGLVSINTARQNISKTAVSVNTARQVNTAHSKTTVNAGRLMSYLSKTAYSIVKRPIHNNTTFKNSNINQRDNTVKGKNVNTVMPKAVVNAVRPKAVVDVGNPQMDLQDQGVIDDRRFLCRYSLNSKAFRVFNSRNKEWKKTYSTQSNGFVGTKASDNADPKSSQDDGSKPSSDDEKMVDEDPIKDSKSIDQEKDDNVNNINNVNAAITNKVNAIGGKTSIELPDDPNMPALEDISIFDLSRDNEDVGAEADMNNLDTTIQVSLIPTTRIHKDHPLNQVIGDLQSATQTRNISKNLEEHGFVSTIQQRTNHKDLQTTCLLAFYHRKNPKKKKDGIFINQHKYVEEILKKFGFTEVKTASTPIETQKPLLKDKNGEEVDVHMYRSMIGSLMYLTSSRPNIMFVVYACARYQVNPKVSHLHAMKRIFSNAMTDVPVINNVDELNEDECFDPGGGEINVEVDDSFTFVTRTFLPYLTYLEVSPLLSSTKNEDIIFDPGIFAFQFSSQEPIVVKCFMKFCSSTCFIPKDE